MNRVCMIDSYLSTMTSNCSKAQQNRNRPDIWWNAAQPSALRQLHHCPLAILGLMTDLNNMSVWTDITQRSSYRHFWQCRPWDEESGCHWFLISGIKSKKQYFTVWKSFFNCLYDFNDDKTLLLVVNLTARVNQSSVDFFSWSKKKPSELYESNKILFSLTNVSDERNKLLPNNFSTVSRIRSSWAPPTTLLLSLPTVHWSNYCAIMEAAHGFKLICN